MAKLIGKSRGKTRELAKKRYSRPGKMFDERIDEKGEGKIDGEEIDGKKVANSLFGHLVVPYPDLGNNSATMDSKKMGHTIDGTKIRKQKSYSFVG